MSRFVIGEKVALISCDKDTFAPTTSIGVIKMVTVDRINKYLYQIILNNQQKIEAFEYQIFKTYE